MTTRPQVGYGDWQTPVELAEAVLRVVSRFIPTPAAIVEPTCGEGAFLVASSRRFPGAALRGFEINRAYARTAQRAVHDGASTVHIADFFGVDWDEVLRSLPDPILLIGNPPWVTNSGLGAIGFDNLPDKSNFKKLSGYDALTGKSNFDISEWMILRLLRAASSRPAVLAMLCKSAVVRRVLEFAAKTSLPISPGGLWRIDTMLHFGASVDAVLFVARLDPAYSSTESWPVYPSLDAKKPVSHTGFANGLLVTDVGTALETQHLSGQSDPVWRSGVKHDCAKVMELERDNDYWRNGIGEVVDVETDFIFPLFKSSDLANERTVASRSVLIPQKALGEDTEILQDKAPKLWSYLSRHEHLLNARKSSIYKEQPRFSIFGIGPYSFAPWKVAISGLYKRLSFVLLGTGEGQPPVVDDTCYFLPFDDEQAARAALEALRSDLASRYFSARIFWDAKRPISKALLQSLDLHRLASALGRAHIQNSSPRQGAFAF